MAAPLFPRAHHQQALHHTKGRNPISPLRLHWDTLSRDAPVAQLAEATDSKPVQCEFESHLGHAV